MAKFYGRGPPVAPVAPAENPPHEESPPLPCLRAVVANSSYPGHKSLTVLVQEGGVGFINYLLTLAISPDDSSLLPAISRVREWHFQDILKFPKREMKEWKMACHEELESLHRCKVFELCNLPHGRKVVCNCWVFDVKSDHWKKAQLVAKGFSQKQSIDYNKIFSPVVCFKTVRMMLGLSALEDWHIEALDIKTAFLYGKLDKEIYMEQPEGFRLKGLDTNKVLCLQDALYGLKQSALTWWQELKSSMKRIGFRCTVSDAGVFFTHIGKDLIMIIVYVDDALFFGKNQRAVKKVKKTFMDIWECCDLGKAKEFLQMRIKHEGHKIYLDQTVYLSKVMIN